MLKPLLNLPIDTRIPEIREKLQNYSVVIVTATPGSGKTTRIPPALLSLTQKKILVLEPRRVAATMAALRIAEENSWTLGKEVGYRVRFENETQPSTRLIFLTEALLMKQMLNDGDLSDVGIVVLDEFHERSVHVDTASALLRELLELGRPDLKVVVMSATIDSAKLNRYWPNSVVIDVEGDTHPLEVAKDKRAQLLRPQNDFYERVVEAVEAGFKNSPGEKDLLVFLPGVREIERSAEALEKSAQRLGFSIHRLHGQLPLSEQKKILRASEAGRRVILSTNVAESAVTVDGLDTVIDSGLERVSQLHPKTGHQSLDLVRISLASARQRAGRAARQGPGLAIQMWSTHDELSMASERPAEILRTEISELVLLLAGLGVSNPKSLEWYEAPIERQINESLTLLQSLGAIQNGKLTDKGRKMLGLPLAPRWSSLTVEAEARGEKDLGLELSALIQGVGPKQRRSSNFLNLFSDWRARPHEFHQAKQILEQLRGRISSSRKFQNEMAVLLWKTFPDRLCRRREGSEDTALMVGGRGVRLPKGEFPRDVEFFLALELIEGLSATDTQCSLYFPLSEDFVIKEIHPLATTKDSVTFDEKQERFWSEKALCFQDLQLEAARRSPAPADKVSGALAQYIVGNWTKFFPRFEGLEDWLKRFRYWSSKTDPALWPISEDNLKKIMEWACDGETTIKSLEKKELTTFFANILLGDREREFDRQCPSHLTSPKGRSLKIDYVENLPPRVEIRIQDAFGWKETPKIMGEPLMVDLLAPNGRPQQRTQDLASFWKNSYKEIRKELRARYPKHAWPEDPTQ